MSFASSFRRIVPVCPALAAFALLLALPAFLAAPTPARGAPNSSWRSWDEGLREAETAERPVLVDVYTDWCGWCRRMERDVYGRADVRDYLARRFVTVKLNAESKAAARYESKRLTEQGIAARFKVSGYPTTVFLRPDGSHLVNVPGYVPAERFLMLLEFVADGHLERGRSFDDFVRVRGELGKPATR